MTSTRVLVLVGSLRADSLNRRIAEKLTELAPEGVSVEIAENLQSLPFYNEDLDTPDRMPATAAALRGRVAAADRVLAVTPEYNGTMPAVLNNAIDWLSRQKEQPFVGKPIALQSASPGPVGGARVQYDLRRTMVFLAALTLNKPEIFIGNCATRIDDKTGEIKDAQTKDLIKQQLAAFAKFIAAHGGKK